MGPGGEWVPRVGKEMRTLEEKNTRILEGSSMWFWKLLRIMPGIRDELSTKVRPEGVEGSLGD